MEKLNISNLNYYLLILLPITIITGPALTELTVILLSAMFLYLFIIDKDKSKYNLTLIYLFIFLYLYLNISSIFSSDWYQTFSHTLIYFRYIFFTLAIYLLLLNNENFLKYFTIIFLLVYFFVIFDALIQYFTGYNIFLFALTNNRLSGVFRDELILGSYLAKFFPFVLSLYLYIFYKKNIRFDKFLIFLIFILSLLLTFLSGERSSFALIIISQFLFIFFIFKINFLKLFFIFFILVSTIFVFLLFDNTLKQRMIDHTFNQVFYKVHQDENVVCNDDVKDCYYKFRLYSISHQGHIQSSLKMFLDKPIIGQGVKMFRIKCNEEKFISNAGCSTHPHNIFFQILAELGIIGVFFYLIFYVYIFGKFFKNYILYKKNHSNLIIFQNGLFVFFIINLFPFLPAGDIFNNYNSIKIYLPLGFLIYTLYKEKNEYIR